MIWEMNSQNTIRPDQFCRHDNQVYDKEMVSVQESIGLVLCEGKLKSKSLMTDFSNIIAKEEIKKKQVTRLFPDYSMFC